MKRKLLAILAAALLALSAAPASASCYGGPCNDVLLPPERTVVYLPSLSGEPAD